MDTSALSQFLSLGPTPGKEMSFAGSVPLQTEQQGGGGGGLEKSSPGNWDTNIITVTNNIN